MPDVKLDRINLRLDVGYAHLGNIHRFGVEQRCAAARRGLRGIPNFGCVPYER